jgi:hypothetical protein
MKRAGRMLTISDLLSFVFYKVAHSSNGVSRIPANCRHCPGDEAAEAILNDVSHDSCH